MHILCYVTTRCCRYAHDTRYSEDSVASHDRQLLPAFPCVKLEQVMGAIGDYDVIAIDEVSCS